MTKPNPLTDEAGSAFFVIRQAERWEADAHQYQQQVQEAREKGLPHDQMLSMMTCLRACAKELRSILNVPYNKRSDRRKDTPKDWHPAMKGLIKWYSRNQPGDRAGEDDSMLRLLVQMDGRLRYIERLANEAGQARREGERT